MTGLFGALNVLVFVCLYGHFCVAQKQLDNVLEWKVLSFQWPSEEAEKSAIANGDYVPEHNLPLGLARWKDKLFITVPRWKSGVAATLNYVQLPATDKSAPLIPYPSWEANFLPKNKSQNVADHIISTFRVDVDKCDRLWVMDTGLADILGSPHAYSKPAIIVYDLKTDKLLRRYELKEADFKEDSFFANINVDSSRDDCDNAFAYVPDLGAYGVVVYSWNEDSSWRVSHNYFHFDPLKGDLYVGGLNFQWTDGVFSFAFARKNPSTGFRTIYFHALASTREFSVSSQVFRNKTIALDNESYHLYKMEGNRGDKTQATASAFDEQSNVLFMTQLQRNGVACWNPKRPLSAETLDLVIQNNETLIFPNDLKLDEERNVWILSDKLPLFVYKGLPSEDINYRIYRISIDDAIRDTKCKI